MIAKANNILDEEILEVLREDKLYRLDIPDYGRVEILSGKTGLPLVRQRMGRVFADPSLNRMTCVALKIEQRTRKISIAKLVWMKTRDRLVPQGFEIHHIDDDCYNDHPDNLLCIYSLDHTNLHRQNSNCPF